MNIQEYFEEEYSAEELEWFSLSPAERWQASMEMWETFLFLGGQLDPITDPDSPFSDDETVLSGRKEERPGLRVIRHGKI